jgi:aldehyde dehydrogenase (NAD+)
MTKDFKYPIPKQPFIHGKFVDAKGLERVSLYSATDDSLVLDGTDGSQHRLLHLHCVEC